MLNGDLLESRRDGPIVFGRLDGRKKKRVYDVYPFTGGGRGSIYKFSQM